MSVQLAVLAGVSEVGGIPAAQPRTLVALEGPRASVLGPGQECQACIDGTSWSTSKPPLCHLWQRLPRSSRALSERGPAPKRSAGARMSSVSSSSLRPAPSSAPSPSPLSQPLCAFHLLQRLGASPIPSALSCPATALPLAPTSSAAPIPTMLSSSCPARVLLSASILCLSPSPFYSPDPREASSPIWDLSPPPLLFHRHQLGPAWRRVSL